MAPSQTRPQTTVGRNGLSATKGGQTRNVKSHHQQPRDGGPQSEATANPPREVHDVAAMYPKTDPAAFVPTFDTAEMAALERVEYANKFVAIAPGMGGPIALTGDGRVYELYHFRPKAAVPSVGFTAWVEVAAPRLTTAQYGEACEAAEREADAVKSKS